jgi:hypothetical protein
MMARCFISQDDLAQGKVWWLSTAMFLSHHPGMLPVQVTVPIFGPLWLAWHHRSLRALARVLVTNTAGCLSTLPLGVGLLKGQSAWAGLVIAFHAEALAAAGGDARTGFGHMAGGR